MVNPRDMAGNAEEEEEEEEEEAVGKEKAQYLHTLLMKSSLKLSYFNNIDHSKVGH